MRDPREGTSEVHQHAMSLSYSSREDSTLLKDSMDTLRVSSILRTRHIYHKREEGH